MRLGPVLVALLAALAAGGAAAAQDKPLIQMGVRVDARPFAWRDSQSGSFLGFLVDLCTDAVTLAGYPFEQVPITAAQRLEVLSGARRDIDLLCDPTTITLRRLSEFAALDPPGSLAFSPIVFVANGSYMVSAAEGSGVIAAPEAPAECLAAAPAEPAPADDGEASAAEPEPTFIAAGYVVGTTVAPVLRTAIRDGLLTLGAGERVCPVVQPSHIDAVAAFCRGELRYYFGDSDIIETNVVEHRRVHGDDACPVDPLPRPISYEPYALAISGRHPGFREDFVRALYEVFHHGTAEDRFQGHFEGRAMSPFLDTLFRINRIPAGSPSAPAAPGEATLAAPAAPRAAERQ